MEPPDSTTPPPDGPETWSVKKVVEKIKDGPEGWAELVRALLGWIIGLFRFSRGER